MGYKDVPSNHIYQKEIEFNQVNGIMTGDENGCFHPTANVIRSHLCVIIATLFDLDYDLFRKKGDEIPDYIPGWVQPYFSACQNMGFMPEHFITTLSEVATIQDLLKIFIRIKQHYLPKDIEFKEIEYSSPEPNQSPLTREKCAFLIFQLCQNISIPILTNLRDPKSSTISEILPIFVRHSWIDFFYSTKYFDVNLYQIYYTIKNFFRRSIDYVKEQLDVMLEIRDKRDTYFVYKANRPVYHYTTLKVMEILTKPGTSFRLSNSVYLNDPQEGFLASSLLAKKSSQKKYRNLRSFLAWFHSTDSDASPYFIASFIKSADSLPMWVHYGEKGSGCCLGINRADFCDDIYEVTYSKTHISKFFSEILDILSSYTASHPKINFYYDPVFQYAKGILDQSCYLYKDSAYKYEEEVRIVRFVPLKTAMAEDIGEIFPKIYWETPLLSKRPDNIGIKFSSIILGPTVENPARIATALAQRGYDSSIVRKSKIKFQ